MANWRCSIEVALCTLLLATALLIVLASNGNNNTTQTKTAEDLAKSQSAEHRSQCLGDGAHGLLWETREVANLSVALVSGGPDLGVVRDATVWAKTVDDAVGFREIPVALDRGLVVLMKSSLRSSSGWRSTRSMFSAIILRMG
ncbi:hypothetical protein PG999_009996 [Apiospora kogelbergensis]|uniref:Uncharacterized protein n=1 Tax=Apiospora kogelbergensis TaxID=1337665 RepID=A0AAW0QKZ7_9PEZI